MQNNHLIIMAGGIGSRFWPMSTPERPKQFIDVLGTGKTLLQAAADRFRRICPPENIWVVTSSRYAEIVKQQLPFLPSHNILLEPCMRNTAPCIAYAAWKIRKQNPKANLIVSPSDHVVLDTIEFQRLIQQGISFVQDNDVLLTLGIKPSRPETGYGYIKGEIGSGDILKVEAFKEKPNRETAERYLADGHYFWNAGIFLWSVASFEKALRHFQPDMASLFDKLNDIFYTPSEQEAINRHFPECNSISIDYALMEHADNIYVQPADFGWSDLGTWGTLHELSPKDKSANAVIGTHVSLVECENCIVHVSDNHRMVLQGLDGYIIAEQNNTFLICKKDEEQRIKEFSNTVK